MNETIAESRTPVNSSTPILLRGFECVDKDLEKIRWLGLGDDFRTFITQDVSQSIHEQDPESIVHSIDCVHEPSYLIKEDPITVGKKEILILEFSAAFFLKVAVSGHGEKWELAVEYQYIISDTDRAGNLNLQQNFIVISQRQL